jgi:hypothetical protein
MKELFDFLITKGIAPNSYYLLWSIYHGISPQNIKVPLEMRAMVQQGYIDNEGKLTSKGLEVVKFNSDVKNSLPQDVSDNIDKFLNIFPKGKLPSGKPARVNKKNIEDSFKWFFKNYTYDWDTILRATWYYIDTYEKTNYMYMKNSQYFIRKQNTDKSWDSELANYCEIVINGDDEDETPHFSDNVV